jgi:hypothetical protein
MDYKPKRVNYDALRRGKTAELMNFFHFDGSEMTLRHLVVTGVRFRLSFYVASCLCRPRMLRMSLNTQADIRTTLTDRRFNSII